MLLHCEALETWFYYAFAVREVAVPRTDTPQGGRVRRDGACHVNEAHKRDVLAHIWLCWELLKRSMHGGMFSAWQRPPMSCWEPGTSMGLHVAKTSATACGT